MGVCNCSMFCCTLLYVHFSIAIILRGKRELIALLNLSSWCLVMVEQLFLTVPRGCLQFVIVVFPDHTHLLLFKNKQKLPQFLYIIFNYLVLHFGEKYMKIRTKIAKLQMNGYLYKNVNENRFSSTFLFKFS